jgi:hypothetical protein
MAIPTVALNETTPAGSSYVREGDNRIIEYKTQVREILEIDHYFPSSGQNAACGRHKQMTLIEAADIGTGASGVPILGAQTVSSKPELCYTDEDDTDVLITSGGKIALQNSRIPNNTYLIARNAAGAANVNILKVNASDIIEFATFPITPSEAPDANYEVSNKKYVDDQITALAIAGYFNTTTGHDHDGTDSKTLFGAWSDCSAAAAHDNELAATDGFVIAYNTSGEAMDIKTDANNPPTTVRASGNGDAHNEDITLMCPVRKGDRWLVNGTVVAVYWLPIGG